MAAGDERNPYRRPFKKRPFWRRDPATAADIMTSRVRCVKQDTPLQEMAEIMDEEDVGIVPVVDDGGRLIGVVTDRDIVVRAFGKGVAHRDLTARDVMTTDVETVPPRAAIEDVLELMRERRVQRIPVVDEDDRVAGIISIDDVVNRSTKLGELRETFEQLSRRRPGEYDPYGLDVWDRGGDAWTGEPAGPSRAASTWEPWRSSGAGSGWRREPLIAREIMSAPARSVRQDVPLAEVVRLMREENIGIVPVVDQQQRLQGVITDRDIVLRVVAPDRPNGTLVASDVMTTDIETASADEPVTRILEKMGRKGARRIPVVDSTARLMGVISLEDVARRADFDEEVQSALQKVASGRSFWRRLASWGP